jgi:hypothetical protein
MSEISHFKVFLLCKMMWHIMLDGCWHDMTWLDVDVYILHVKKIGVVVRYN